LLSVSLFLCSQAASVAILPSALFGERFSLGASWVFTFQKVLLPENRPLLPPFGESQAPGLSRSHLDSAVELGCPDRNSLARIIRDCEDAKGRFCYKHVVETVFVMAREALACLTITRRSVCCFPTFSPSLQCSSLISGRVVPTAEPCC